VADVELKRRSLSPDRWALLARHASTLPGQQSDTGLIAVAEAIEIEGVTFLPAVYYPA
jgi:hypothetical protein